MVRKKREWFPELFYHVTSRGNRREALFKEKSDFQIFMNILQNIHDKAPFELASYCLMTNHYHLQIRSQEQSISKVMSLINKRYADYYNAKYGFSGHVFEKRFYSELIESPLGMLKVSRYIHLNPVRANIVQDPEDYRWSSYRYYLYTKGTNILNTELVLSYFSGDDWEKRRQYEEYMYKKEEIKLEVKP